VRTTILESSTLTGTRSPRAMASMTSIPVRASASIVMGVRVPASTPEMWRRCPPCPRGHRRSRGRWRTVRSYRARSRGHRAPRSRRPWQRIAARRGGIRRLCSDRRSTPEPPKSASLRDRVMTVRHVARLVRARGRVEGGRRHAGPTFLRTSSTSSRVKARSVSVRLFPAPAMPAAEANMVSASGASATTTMSYRPCLGLST
jgi:hypothetical protein